MTLQMRTPSVVPVTLPTTRPPTPAEKTWIVACGLLGLLLGMGGVIAMPAGSIAKIASAVRGGHAQEEKRSPEIKTERAPASAAPEPAPAAPVSSAPTITIEPDLTIVNFPARAKRRRVWFDGVPLQRHGAQTMKLQCGAHTIKIGATGPTSPVQLPCGGEATIL
jgi:hypothetical protein